MNKPNYKLILLFVISLASLLIFYFVEDKEVFINFFFLPTLLAGYAYDAKGGVITAVISIAFVSIIAFMSFDNYVEFITNKVLLWGCFLIISGYIIGTLTEKINAIYLGTIATLALAMESRDPYTYGHSSRVAEIAVRIAKKMRFPKNEQTLIRTAGILHDIGKFGIREDILRKKEPLTREEYDHIRQHPLIGASILSPIKLLKNIIPYIYYHHEHMDGTGYLHKKGVDIPLQARILAVADAYDAMTTDRPYRNALNREKILDIFNMEKDKQFDGRVVDALLSLTDNLRINIEAHAANFKGK
ncbi:MAG: HD domain-containing protein [Candidatus Omnitrophica bacterium]|nr:HD domain-containing protein [Candidatus Omnitrophota bacterium]MCG2705668.1 HD domain-containing protein [Candidatus Omnitrophota bacterium]